jgi:hypothetical protein
MSFLGKTALQTQITDLLVNPRSTYLEDAHSLLERCNREGLTSASLPLMRYLEWVITANAVGEAGRIGDMEEAIAVAASWAQSVELPLTVRNVLRALEQHKNQLLLMKKVARGFEAIRTEPSGTNVYLDVDVYQGRSQTEGRLLVSDKGIRYAGAVRLEIPWSKIVHIHRENAQEFGIQEAKRRSLTRFGFLSGDWNEHFAVLEWCWRQFQDEASV